MLDLLNALHPFVDAIKSPSLAFFGGKFLTICTYMLSKFPQKFVPQYLIFFNRADFTRSLLSRIGVYSLYFFFFWLNCWANLAQETIYLTWQKSPSTSMTIQWVSSAQEKSNILLYRTKNKGKKWQRVASTAFSFPSAPQYLIHRIEIDKLQPNTEYIFQLLPYPEEYQFLTAPSDLSDNLHFVVGGDIYHDGIALLVKMCQQAAKTSPLFSLIGGDIAYAVTSYQAGSQVIERWLEWIKVWHSHMVTPEGSLIPIIPAIGNHDLIGQFDQTPNQAAVF